MLQFRDDIYIDLVPGEQLLYKPRLILNDTKIQLTAANSAEIFEKEVANSVGSAEDWLHFDRIDSFGFDKETRLLKLVCLYYPETNYSHGNIDRIKNTTKVIGVPRLTALADFDLPPFIYRHYNLENDLFMCFNDVFSSINSFEEVQIAENVSLFFGNGSYCAWGLYHPEIYLTDHIGVVSPHSSSEFLKNSLAKAFELITLETVSLMDEKDKT